MRTKLTEKISEAVEILKLSGIVAFPTETVFGLGANVFDKKAIKKIFIAKNRPGDNPLIAHVGSIDDVEKLTSNITDSARKFIDAFFPAPLTIVLQKSTEVPLLATAGLQTIGVRMPKHELALELIRECGFPLVAPSANLSGKPSPTTWEAVFEDLDGKIEGILKGEPTEIGLESTVVDCTGEIPMILRFGAITLEQLQAIIPETIIYQAKPNEIAKSPGIKHRHYAPNARIVLVDQPGNANPSKYTAYVGINQSEQPEKFGLFEIFENENAYAHSVFRFFREADAKNIKTIFCQKVKEEGIGLALMDRLKRASQS